MRIIGVGGRIDAYSSIDVKNGCWGAMQQNVRLKT